ncbi:hypothetical protein SNE40_011392 [Patella caerulea]|uniref:G-protein coupled receptors family 1 profile domain-containing protein n=2 Tax=Patella caerulea TaxID=87958 RepID=A0AAN8JML1_PATCE
MAKMAKYINYSVNITDAVESSLLVTKLPPIPNMCHFEIPQENWEKEVEFYLNGIFTTIVITLGLIGNLLTVIVLTRRTMHTSTNFFLTALAIWDSIVLLSTFVLICLGTLSTYFKSAAFPYIVIIVYPIALAAQTSTIWLTVSFTVERYIAVCHPLKAASMCTIARARLVIIGISAISLIYNIPRWFDYQIIDYKYGPTNETCVIVDQTEFGKSPLYHKIYFGWLYFLVMCVIPLCSLAVLNTLLIIAVKHSQQQRIDMNVRQSRENNVTIMLVSVVIVFMMCQVPALIYNMAYAIDIEATRSMFGWKILSSIRNFLVTFNSAINFMLYCALGQKFRRTFVRTFCSCISYREKNNLHSFTHNYQMDTIKVNGKDSSKYMKMLCKKGKHVKEVTEMDSGVVTHLTVVSRYSPRTSVDSELSTNIPPDSIEIPYSRSERIHLTCRDQVYD